MKNRSLDNFLLSSTDEPRNLLTWEQRFKIAFGALREGSPTSMRSARIALYRTLTRNIGYLAPEWLANLPVASNKICTVMKFGKGNIKNILHKRLAEFQIDKDQVMRTIQVLVHPRAASQQPKMGKVMKMLGVNKVEIPLAPKATLEGSVGRTSINASGSTSAPSTFAASALAPPLFLIIANWSLYTFNFWDEGKEAKCMSHEHIEAHSIHGVIKAKKFVRELKSNNCQYSIKPYVNLGGV
ncbi:hypothetical protein Ancab_032290 [Ancistrocladus abbreviatus]